MIKTVTWADDLSAPAELTQIIDPDLVDAVLDDTGAREHRVRLLPSRVVLYFVLAFAFFENASYQAVWGKLTTATPSRSAPGRPRPAPSTAPANCPAHKAVDAHKNRAGMSSWGPMCRDGVGARFCPATRLRRMRPRNVLRKALTIDVSAPTFPQGKGFRCATGHTTGPGSLQCRHSLLLPMGKVVALEGRSSTRGVSPRAEGLLALTSQGFNRTAGPHISPSTVRIPRDDDLPTPARELPKPVIPR
ncbi:transposase domain-containing protein [Streptomyces sp. ATMOS53]|jgi:hypothetical protein